MSDLHGDSDYAVAVHEPNDQRNHPLLRLLSAEDAIIIRRWAVELTGSLTAGAMLTQALYWMQRSKDPAGWFYKTHKQWTTEILLTKNEQEGARKKLRQHDWWQEELRNANGRATLYYRINLAELARKLFPANSTSGENHDSEIQHDDSDIQHHDSEFRTSHNRDYNKDYDHRLHQEEDAPSADAEGGRQAAGAPQLPAEGSTDLVTEEQPETKELTPQQEMFGAVCDAIGWDYKTLTKSDSGQVAQATKKLIDAGYTVDDIRAFMLDIWFKDWRWEKHASRPTLKQLRQEIGKVRAGVPEEVYEREKLSEAGQAVVNYYRKKKERQERENNGN